MVFSFIIIIINIVYSVDEGGREYGASEYFSRLRGPHECDDNALHRGFRGAHDYLMSGLMIFNVSSGGGFERFWSS